MVLFEAMSGLDKIFSTVLEAPVKEPKWLQKIY